VPLANILAEFKASVAQCDSLIASAHRNDAAGAPLFPIGEQQQITIAAFLNMFIAWEAFLEATLAEFMLGNPTLNGTNPVRYVTPPTVESAKAIVIHVREYFDYGNHGYLKKVVDSYFRGGYPFQPHLNALIADLGDLRTMRNSAAHISSTTQTALEGLALRLLKTPSIGISLYTLLMKNDPDIVGNTIFVSYRDKLLLAAELIAQG
jgi:hypothetical protein